MNSKFLRILALLLSLVFMVSCFAACGDTKEDDPKESKDENNSEAETLDAASQALADLGDVNWGNETFGILHMDGFKNEVYGENGVVDKESGAAQVINDAVYERNVLFEDFCHLKLETISKDAASVEQSMRNEATTATGDFQMIDYHLGGTANMALSGMCYNFLDMDIDVDQPWWDTGTADFCLAGNIFFMSGDVNFADDNVTYVLIFNKKLQVDTGTPDPYKTVKDWEWTLEYFNNIIQNISSDSNGDGKWDENDTYGFVTTWEYGNTFFIGSDLKYIVNDRNSDAPTLFLEDKMDKALAVLDLSKQIYHNNNASYMSPPGQEGKGLSCFKGGRALFYGEVASYLAQLNADMEGDYGVLPVPKYDKAQEFYRTWTHGSGSCVSVTSAITEDKAELVGDIVEAYAILSSQKVKPAYYDIMLTSRNIRDAESAEMLDLIFQNRVYDMSAYFSSQFGNFWEQTIKTSVNNNDDKFSSKYKSAAKGFDKKVQKLLNTLEKK